MRRSRLPRIRLKALEAPDLRDIGRKLPHRMDGEGLDAVGVVSLVPFSPNNRSCARPCPPAGAFGHRAPAGETEAGRQNG